MLGPEISLSDNIRLKKGYNRGYSRLCRDLSYHQSHSMKGDYIKTLINDDVLENYKKQEHTKLNTIRTMIAQKVCGFLEDTYEDSSKKNNFFHKITKKDDNFYTNNSCDLRSFSNISPIPGAQSNSERDSKAIVSTKNKQISSFAKRYEKYKDQDNIDDSEKDGTLNNENSSWSFNNFASYENKDNIAYERIKSSDIEKINSQYKKDLDYMSRKELFKYSNLKPNSQDTFVSYKKEGTHKRKSPQAHKKDDKNYMNQDAIVTTNLEDDSFIDNKLPFLKKKMNNLKETNPEAISPTIQEQNQYKKKLTKKSTFHHDDVLNIPNQKNLELCFDYSDIKSTSQVPQNSLLPIAESNKKATFTKLTQKNEPLKRTTPDKLTPKNESNKAKNNSISPEQQIKKSNKSKGSKYNTASREQIGSSSAQFQNQMINNLFNFKNNEENLESRYHEEKDYGATGQYNRTPNYRNKIFENKSISNINNIAKGNFKLAPTRTKTQPKAKININDKYGLCKDGYIFSTINRTMGPSLTSKKSTTNEYKSSTKSLNKSGNKTHSSGKTKGSGQRSRNKFNKTGNSKSSRSKKTTSPNKSQNSKKFSNLRNENSVVGLKEKYIKKEDEIKKKTPEKTKLVNDNGLVEISSAKNKIREIIRDAKNNISDKDLLKKFIYPKDDTMYSGGVEDEVMSDLFENPTIVEYKNKVKNILKKLKGELEQKYDNKNLKALDWNYKGLNHSLNLAKKKGLSLFERKLRYEFLKSKRKYIPVHEFSLTEDQTSDYITNSNAIIKKSIKKNFYDETLSLQNKEGYLVEHDDYQSHNLIPQIVNVSRSVQNAGYFSQMGTKDHANSFEIDYSAGKKWKSKLPKQYKNEEDSVNISVSYRPDGSEFIEDTINETKKKDNFHLGQPKVNYGVVNYLSKITQLKLINENNEDIIHPSSNIYIED